MATDVCDLLVPVTLVVGPEELLVDRAVAAVTSAVRAADPDADVRDLLAVTVEVGMISELLSPSLFGERRAVVLRGVQDLAADVVGELRSYLSDPLESIALVLVHAGAAKGKAMLDVARKAGAREVGCPKVTKPGERVSFVRQEFRRVGRGIQEEAARLLLDSVGSDLRELSAACSQLAADTSGTIDEEVVARYYTGRAEVTSFTVADRALEGRTAEALEQLRWALAVGVAPVLITSALAQGVRSLARVGAAPRGLRSADLARDLGMPPWKVDRVRQQLREWNGEGVARALQAVAHADAAVKGGGDDSSYALERAVITVAGSRSAR
jgi:DNA polymerase III subunit delta